MEFWVVALFAIFTCKNDLCGRSFPRKISKTVVTFALFFHIWSTVCLSSSCKRLFYVKTLVTFNCFRPGHWLEKWWNYHKMKKKAIWAFIFQKFGKFWRFLLEHNIDFNTFIYEKCMYMRKQTAVPCKNDHMPVSSKPLKRVYELSFLTYLIRIISFISLSYG